jgi:hypothetical protein
VRFSASQLEQRFTAPANFKLWPQAMLHTQWPGEGPKKGRHADAAAQLPWTNKSVPFL